MAFTWKGALLWKMQASMGDVVFTPLYEVLKQKNVKFAFFNRVTNLGLSADKKSIQNITLLRQAKVKEDKEYQPLVNMKGIPSWPSDPLYDQLVDGENLKEVNFESYCDKHGETYTLNLDRDFDRVILGIPVGGLPYIACELIQSNLAWKNMVDHVKTARTQALQLWFKKTGYELGQPNLNEPLSVTYDESPLNTFADMTFLIERENWPALNDHYPLSLYYLCGPMKDEIPLADTPCGPKQDCKYMNQQEEDKISEKVALELLTHHFGTLLPKSTNPNDDKKAPLDWDLLVDNRSPEQTGEKRLSSQFIRANVSPSERFVLSVKGSTKFRLKPFVNWRAFDFMYFCLLLISLFWEASLGLPYGWWQYHNNQMLGVFIGAWSNLPIEAVLLWFAASWVLYEALRIYFYMK